jgi:NAD(P)-dependent dehydrogenase (short-subunit alcohol dehydrogenase family)
MPRVFFVTGSSTGIGHALVEEILRQGDYVIATARKPETLQFSLASLTNFVAVPLDLLDPNSVLTAFLTGVAKFGRIDVVVNNGGYGLSGPFEDLTDEDIKRQMDVNFTGALLSTRAAIKVMREQTPPGGVIQQITSIGGRIGMPWMSMYSASKFALEGLTEAVAQEMDPKWRIKFTCIEPGGFR